MKPLTIVIVAVGIALAVSKGSVMVAESIGTMLDTQAIEDACVKTLVEAGTERINIATLDGECWEEENGYYK